ncbi:hypothetical protein CLU79DRAFT_761451 [Phycomyces nitens]|nr:hypothetical protein CLU79DRAFT_761451 [Phycomyces nitens]
MSLLLTTTCDYALLVAIQQGRHFLPRNDDDVCIESKLELRLPEAVDDLILPTTIISTRPATIDPDGQVIFRTTLAYLVSTKLLSRLRTYNAHVLLTISTLSADCTRTSLGVVRLQLSTAKMVVQRHGQRQLHEVNRFVVDKGSWQPLPSREEQVKAGLFIVAMPDHYRSTSKATSSMMASESMMGGLSGSGLELRSLNIDPFLLPSEPLLSDSTSTLATTSVRNTLPSPPFTSSAATSLMASPALSFLKTTAFSRESTRQPIKKKTLTKALEKKTLDMQLSDRRRRAKSTDQPRPELQEPPPLKDRLRRAQSQLDLNPNPEAQPRSTTATDKATTAATKDTTTAANAAIDQLSSALRHIQLLPPMPKPPSKPPSKLQSKTLPRAHSRIQLKTHSSSSSRQLALSPTPLSLPPLSLKFSLSSLPTKPTTIAKPTKSTRTTKTTKSTPTETPDATEVTEKAAENTSSSLPQPQACSTTGEDVLRYHQIGKGTSSYTFYFNIVHADHLQPLLRSSSRRRRGVDHTPFFTYAFLSKTISCPASSFSSSHQAWQTCFHLRGHLYDIQEWLDDQCRLQLSLVLVDANDSTNPLKKDTVGMAQVPLAGLAFESPFLSSDPYNQPSRRTSAIDRILTERSFPVYDLNRRHLSVTPSEEIAKVTVRLGLVSGWWSESSAGTTRIPTDSLKRNNSHTDADPWDNLKNKKVRHLSTSTATNTSNTLDSGRTHQVLHSILNSRNQPRKKPYLHT